MTTLLYQGMTTEDIVAAMLTQAHMSRYELPVDMNNTFSFFTDFREKIRDLIKSEIPLLGEEE